MSSKKEIEEGRMLQPKFDANGLITAVATRYGSSQVLMVAHMNAQALALTIETGIAHYWSRSRNTLWKKGESSGQLQYVKEMRVDCDQDAVWMQVDVAGDGGCCHTGRSGCFYRTIPTGQPDGMASTETSQAPLLNFIAPEHSHSK